jgi:hypothetical protein
MVIALSISIFTAIQAILRDKKRERISIAAEKLSELKRALSSS